MCVCVCVRVGVGVFPLLLEIGGTFVIFSLFLYPQCMGLQFWGTEHHFGDKNPLQRVNGTAAVTVMTKE